MRNMRETPLDILRREMQEKSGNPTGEIICMYKNGKCSRCGSCCGRVLPLNNRDIKRIRNFVKKHEVKCMVLHPLPLSNEENHMCPFLIPNRDGTRRCSIYEIRPNICRLFSCNNTHGKLPGNISSYKSYDLYKLFGIKD